MLRSHRYLRWAFAVFAILICLDAILIIVFWPFKRESEIASLERLTESRVGFGRFEVKVFPSPGFDAENISVFRFEAGKPITLAYVRSMQCRTSWLNVFSYTHRITRFDLRGLRADIPDHIPQAMHLFPGMKSKTTVDQLAADGAVLELRRSHFVFTRLRLSNLKGSHPIGYDISTELPQPHGVLSVLGNVGPLSRPLAKTPLSGKFQLGNADLSSFKTLRGMLGSNGRYDGTIGGLQVEAHLRLRGFHLSNVSHAVNLTGDLRATANCSNADIDLQQLGMHFDNTDLYASGSILDKVLRVSFLSRRARLEDLLLLVVSGPPPASGNVTLDATATVPPDGQPFLRKLQLAGSFDVEDAQFAKPQTEGKLEQLSARSRGIRGHDLRRRTEARFAASVLIRDGTARLPELAFAVPGATARGNGTFNLISKAIDIKGKLAMQASLSSAAGGLKGIALLPLDPFFHKGGAGAVVPVAVSGTYSHPSFKVKLFR